MDKEFTSLRHHRAVTGKEDSSPHGLDRNWLKDMNPVHRRHAETTGERDGEDYTIITCKHVGAVGGAGGCGVLPVSIQVNQSVTPQR